MSWIDELEHKLNTDLGKNTRSKYYDDPVLFARECIAWKSGEELTDYQEDVLHSLVEHFRVAVRGPHGLGKTTTQAIVILWFAITRDLAGVDWKVASTAGAWRQLERYLWPEIHKWAKRLRWDVIGRKPFNLYTELLALNLKLDHGAGFAVASNDPQLIEGVHADEVLYVFDESKAISGETFDAAEGAFSGSGGEGIRAYALATSTPGTPSGRFYDIHARKPGFEDWHARHVTLAECMAAGRVSQKWVDARRAQWGETSGVFANRVLGEFHSDDEDGVIPLAWVEAAVERWKLWDEAGRPTVEGRITVGVDVAREGNDKTVFALRQGPVVSELRKYSKQDTMETTGKVVGVLNASEGCVAIVDVIGVGGGVVDRLREKRLAVEPFNASAGTTKLDRTRELGFVNSRSGAWWNLRELLDPAYGANLALPDDDDLIGDLVKPTWRVMSGGRIQVESKDDIKKRNSGKSTDCGDAVVQAFWDGASEASDWTEYLKRKAANAPEPEPEPVEDPREAQRRAQFAQQRRSAARRGTRY